MKRTILFTLVAASALLAVLACQNTLSGSSDPSDSDFGRLTVAIDNSVRATTIIAPGLDMKPDQYVVTLTDPDSEDTPHDIGTATSRTFSGLTPGSWTVTVDAFEESILIGSGSTAVEVVAGQRATASIEVTELPGTGTLNLNVTWPADLFDDPEIVASLRPAGSTDAGPLAFVPGTNSATYEDTDLAVGYYELSITLEDDGVPTWGRVYSVRIVSGQLSEKTFDLSEGDITTGAINVVVVTNFSNPYEVDFVWNPVDKIISTGDTISADITLDPDDAPTDVRWFLNGIHQQGESGTSITLDGLSAGDYWLDALVRHGNILSSHGDSFQVE